VVWLEQRRKPERDEKHTSSALNHSQIDSLGQLCAKQYRDAGNTGES
jgi:hypothetical protein